MYNKNNYVFGVISAIGNDYGIYSYKERLEQLLGTIESIERFAPGSDIILIDASENILPERDLKILQSKVTHLVLLYNDTYISFLKYHSKDPSPNKFEKKTVGEIRSCVTFLELLKQLPKQYDRVFKLGGRLTLNANFNLDLYRDEDKLVLLEKEQWYDEMIFPMRLWSFSYKNLDKFLELFHTIQEHTFSKVTNTSKLDLVEFSFTNFVEKLQIPYRTVSKIGVCGSGGLSGGVINE